MLRDMLWGELKTPAALVDLDKLESNTARMLERMDHVGVKLRPHVKTHKCVEAARLKDEGPTHIDPDCGFGTIVSSDDGRVLDGLRVASLSQEHGKIQGLSPTDVEPFPVGSKLRVLPNHSCLSAALFDRYHVARGHEVIEEWRPIRGW